MPLAAGSRGGLPAFAAGHGAFGLRGNRECRERGAGSEDSKQRESGEPLHCKAEVEIANHRGPLIVAHQAGRARYRGQM